MALLGKIISKQYIHTEKDLQYKYPKRNSYYCSTPNKIFVDVKFELASNRDPDSTCAKISGKFNAIYVKKIWK